jgi:hypothetical protein
MRQRSRIGIAECSALFQTTATGLWPCLHVEGVCRVIVSVNVVHRLVEIEGPEHQVQQLYELGAVRSVANKVRLNCHDASVWELYLDVSWNINGDAIDDARVQYGVPVFSHIVEEFRALNRVAELNVGA